jgi:hypothetical protein
MKETSRAFWGGGNCDLFHVKESKDKTEFVEKINIKICIPKCKLSSTGFMDLGER